jgi:hypothetical protein
MLEAQVGAAGAYCGMYRRGTSGAYPRSIMYGGSVGSYMTAQMPVMPGDSYSYEISGASGYTCWEI